MKFVAAYLLAHLGAASSGEEEAAGTPAPSPSKEDVRRILDSVGAEVEEDRMDLLFERLEGKVDLAELIAVGRQMLAYAPSGGAAAAAAPAAEAAEVQEEEEEDKKKVEEEDVEEEDGGLFGLFD